MSAWKPALDNLRLHGIKLLEATLKAEAPVASFFASRVLGCPGCCLPGVGGVAGAGKLHVLSGTIFLVIVVTHLCNSVFLFTVKGASDALAAVCVFSTSFQRLFKVKGAPFSVKGAAVALGVCAGGAPK